MRSPLKLALALAGVCALALSVARADVPQNMGVQGRLTDSAGDPVAPGLKIFTFKIFDAEVNGTEIWPSGTGENQTLSTDADGLWNANVGANNPLTEAVFADTSRWLEVTVDDGVDPAETLPRIKLNTNPWAHQAVSSDTADYAAYAEFANDAGEAGNALALDGLGASEFAYSTHMHEPLDINPQGPTSGLDADLLDGVELGAIQTEIDDDIAAHAVSGSHDARYVNVSGDIMSSFLTVPEINLGASGIDGSLELWDGGAGTVVLRAEPFSPFGGSLSIFDGSGGYALELFADPSGSGGQIAVHAPNGTVEIDGDFAGTGDPRLSMSGSQSWMTFSTNDLGTDAVRLPSDAIDTSEIKDEPGIASANTSASVTLTNNMQDIETVSISIPAGGYIVVEGDCIGRSTGTVGQAQGWIQIDETAGGSSVPPHALFYGLASHATVAGYNAFPVRVSRVYLKGSAGSYTFRLEGMAVSGNAPGATVSAASPTLTAKYYPTSYGSVATMVSAAEAGEFPSAQAVNVDADPTDPNAPQGGEVLYEVDLRDLEIKLARANAAAEEARRELEEAQRLNDRPRQTRNLEQ